MSWALIAAKVALLWLQRWLTRDAEKREKKKECLKEIKDAVKKKDPTAITAAFDRANRI